MIIIVHLLYISVKHFMLNMQRRFLGRGRARGAARNANDLPTHQLKQLGLQLNSRHDVEGVGHGSSLPQTNSCAADRPTQEAVNNSLRLSQNTTRGGASIMPGGYSDSDDDLDDFTFSCDYYSQERAKNEHTRTSQGKNITTDQSTENKLNMNNQQTSVCSAPNISHEEWIQSILRKKSRYQRAQLNEAGVNEYWQLQVQSLWYQKEKRGFGVPKLLHQAFAAVTNPYDLTVHLIEKSRDYSKGKTNTLSFTIAREFEKWIQGRASDYSAYLDRDLRIRAFDLSTRSQMNMFDSIAKTFQFCHKDNDYFLPFITKFLENKKYKEAALCVAKTGLHDHFELDDIVVPLLLQDKINLVETYVYRRKVQQQQLVKLLDYLCDPDTNILEFVQRYDVTGVRMEKLHPKVLSKLAIRLMKLYQIPQETCPNINNKRGLGGLRYLMYKKYIECSLDMDGFDDLIKDTVGESDWLKNQLIDLLTSYNDFEGAARWAKFYSLPIAELPHQVISALESMDNPEMDRGEEDWESKYRQPRFHPSIHHHQLQLPLEAICHINTQEDFRHCLVFLSQPDTVVGMDAEWRPSIMQSKPAGIALLQLATTTRIFLLDMLALKPQCKDTDWLYMAEHFWCSNNSLKLGYGFDSDLKVLADTIPVLKKPLSNIQRLVDLQWLNGQILRIYPEFYEMSYTSETMGSANQEQEDEPEEDWGDEPYQFELEKAAAPFEADTRVYKTEERGLSELVRLCLGRPLDKSQQMTNWELRPLRTAQIMYAALDAYCLLEVYNVMKRRVTELGLEINMEPEVTGKVPAASHRSRQQRMQDCVQERPAGSSQDISQKPPLRQPRPSRPETNPSEFAVVCDTMLQGLGRHLRACGVDVKILENTEDHDKAAEIARRENRIVLTSGMPFYSLRSQVPHGMCYSVPAGKAKDQLADVLDYFNVKVTQKDLFSRCQVCNNNKYLYVSPEALRAAKKKKEQIVKKRQVSTLMQPPKFSSLPDAQGSPLDRNLMKQAQRAAAVTTIKDDPAMQNYKKGSVGFASSEADMFDEINMETLSLNNGCPIRVETVPYPIIDKVDVFYICTTCGKVFWEGGHLARVTDQYKHLLMDEGDDDHTDDSDDSESSVEISFSSSAVGLQQIDS